MKIRSLIEFSGVPNGTTGEAERDGDLWKITWNLPLRLFGAKRKPLTDWFNDWEFKKYLIEL